MNAGILFEFWFSNLKNEKEDEEILEIYYTFQI
jgi:hypothetical protein